MQIMRVFARGEDDSTFVNVTLPNGSRRSISLRQLSRLDEAVHKEVYVGLLHQILREMPMVSLLQLHVGECLATLYYPTATLAGHAVQNFVQ